ncbi:MAG: ABC transporter substrate-binding protein [Oscillospiraceae bacterium]|nr:ABC transporter substrate-binding protein [Oscillospiraceae bacterium]
MITQAKIKLCAAGLAGLCLICLAGCDADFFYPDILEPAATPSPEIITPIPAALPDQKPNINAFGIAYTPPLKKGFDPLGDDRPYNGMAARLCYEGLFELNENLAPVPLLAEGYATEDNITYTVKIKKTAAFWDGSPVRADDAVYSLNKAKEGKRYSERLANMASAQPDGKNSLIITMNAPVFNAMALLDVPIVKKGSSGNSVGSGPYRLSKGEDGDFLLANKRWHLSQEPLAIGRIELIKAHKPDDLARGFSQKHISVLSIDPYATVSPGIQAGDRRSYHIPAIQIIGFNFKKASLGNSPALRRGLTLATDRQGLMQQVYGGYTLPCGIPFPPYSEFYNAEGDDKTRFQLNKAKELLSGFSGQLDLIVDNSSPYRIQAAELYASMMKKQLKISINVRVLGWDAFQQALNSGGFDMYFAEINISPNFSPRTLLSPQGAGGILNFGKYGSKEMNKAIHALETAVGKKALVDAVEAFTSLFADQAPFIVLGFRKGQVFSQFGQTEGLEPSYCNPYRNWQNVSVNLR